jgi:hypothetical protein
MATTERGRYMSMYDTGFSDRNDLRAMYQIAVMNAIRSYKGGDRYRLVIEQDLRPLLIALGREDWCGMFRTSILGLATFGTVDMNAAELAYVQKLCEFVQSSLRFTEGGEPAGWVVQAVHGDACGLDGDLAWIRAGSGNRAAAIRIEVEVVDDGEFSVDGRFASSSLPTLGHKGAGRFDLGREWHRRLSFAGFEKTRALRSATGLRLSTTDWMQLRDIAIAALDSGINTLKQIHEAQTSDYERKRSDFKAGVTEDYAPSLVDWLWGRNESIPRGYQRNQVYRLLAALGLDSPVTISRNKPPDES